MTRWYYNPLAYFSNPFGVYTSIVQYNINAFVRIGSKMIQYRLDIVHDDIIFGLCQMSRGRTLCLMNV